VPADSVIRVLVVDDSALYRQLVRNVLRDVPAVEVVGMAASGDEALEQLDTLNPDLLTLDVNMPGLNGIEVLRVMRRRRSPARAVMLSGLTAEGAQVTTDALLEGAFDFILKPSSRDAIANRAALLAALTEKIQAFRDSRTGPRVATAAAAPVQRASQAVGATANYEAIVVGTSTGGPVALREVLTGLPGDFPAPILIVQHMPAQYTHSLAQRLNEISEIEVVEATDGMTLEPGWAFLAPGGRHMRLARRRGRLVIEITDDPPENSCRPSADYLFRSAAAEFGGRVMAVVLTGMGRDGLEGCRALKACGAHVIAQHPEGCTVYGMPKAIIDDELADEMLPLNQIAEFLNRGLRRSHTRTR
jgi:two-component system chemotaxis response regulator CheB